MQQPTRIQLDETRAFEIRPVDGQFAAVLTVASKADYTAGMFPTYQEALNAAAYWVLPEQQQVRLLQQERIRRLHA